MPLKTLIIGFGAGLASAFLLLAASTGPLATRIIIYMLAPLPLVLAGLASGAVVAGIAAIVSATALLLMVGPKVAAIQALSHGIPITVLTHLAQLNRDGQYGPEWYPLGRIIAAATLMAGVIGFITTILLGADLDEQRLTLRKLVDLFFERMPQFQSRPFDEGQIGTLVEVMLYALPAASAFSWLLGMLLNLYLGSRITAASGHLARPLPDVPTMVFPAGFGLGLAAALALTFVGGALGFIGSGFAGAFFCANLLLGLAIIHDISRGIAGRPVLLVVLYALLVALNSWIALGLVVFALLSPILPLRRGNPPPAPDPD